MKTKKSPYRPVYKRIREGALSPEDQLEINSTRDDLESRAGLDYDQHYDELEDKMLTSEDLPDTFKEMLPPEKKFHKDRSDEVNEKRDIFISREPNGIEWKITTDDVYIAVARDFDEVERITFKWMKKNGARPRWLIIGDKTYSFDNDDFIGQFEFDESSEKELLYGADDEECEDELEESSRKPKRKLREGIDYNKLEKAKATIEKRYPSYEVEIHNPPKVVGTNKCPITVDFGENLSSDGNFEKSIPIEYPIIKYFHKHFKVRLIYYNKTDTAIDFMWGESSVKESSRKFKGQFKPLFEKESFHRDSSIQLADQMSKYIDKHDGNINSVVNDVSLGLFMAFSNYYKNDGKKETTGADIIKKVMKKLSGLITEYPELETVDTDFELDGVELEDAGELPSEGDDLQLEDAEEWVDENGEGFDSEDEEELEEEGESAGGVQVASDLPRDISSDRRSKELEEGTVGKYEIDWWQERDRASIIVSNAVNGKTLWECWDEEVQELIEDGFVKWGRDEMLLKYLASLKIPGIKLR